MRDVSCSQGPAELEKIKKYAINSLDYKENLFIQAIDKKVKAYINEKSNDFLTFNEIVKLNTMWKKYQHLKPFVFPFDPEKAMPKVFQNRVAFIIWTVWRTSHLLDKEDLKGAAIAAADILSNPRLPYLSKMKKAAEKFAIIMENTGYRCLNDLSFSFWKEKIFPYLDGTWEFKWELKS